MLYSVDVIDAISFYAAAVSTGSTQWDSCNINRSGIEGLGH